MSTNQTLQNELNAYSSSSRAYRVLNVNALIPEAYDYIDVDESGSTTDVYTFKANGASGTTIGTITVAYTDSSKGGIDYVEKT